MPTLLLVGNGKMGNALLSRWQTSRPKSITRFIVIDPTHAPKSSALVKSFKGLEALPKNISPSVVVFAVKPQQLTALLPAYAKRFGAAPLYLSIAAGKPLAGLAAGLGDKARIVRAMPNLPAVIGKGMTVLCATPSVSGAHKNVALQLMRSAGHVVWIDDEKMMDGITAISGNGPAYLFLFMEALTDAALQCGIPEKLATQLVRQAMIGGALLAEKNNFADLRKQVTSPGGTTEAALKVLMKNDALKRLILDAVEAAARRSITLQ